MDVCSGEMTAAASAVCSPDDVVADALFGETADACAALPEQHAKGRRTFNGSHDRSCPGSPRQRHVSVRY